MRTSIRKVYVSQEFADGTIDRKKRMLESLARILSKNYGVIIIFSPTGECSTNRERMILPYEKNVDEALLLGLTGHEIGHLLREDRAGHFRGTDFDIRKEIANYPGILNRPLLYVVFNCLEDVRIEIQMEEDYEGFVDLFQRMIPYIRDEKERLVRRTHLKHWLTQRQWEWGRVEKILQLYDTKEKEAVRKACVEAGLSDQFTTREVSKVDSRLKCDIPVLTMILDVVYLHLRGYPTDWYPRVILECVEDMESIITKVYSCNSSQEVLDVAVELYKLIEEMPEKGMEDLFDKRGDKSKNQEAEEGNDEGENTRSVNLGPGKRIGIGSRVHHLYNYRLTGVVTDIKDKEIIVEWDE